MQNFSIFPTQSTLSINNEHAGCNDITQGGGKAHFMTKGATNLKILRPHIQWNWIAIVAVLMCTICPLNKTSSCFLTAFFEIHILVYNLSPYEGWPEAWHSCSMVYDVMSRSYTFHGVMRQTLVQGGKFMSGIVLNSIHSCCFSPSLLLLEHGAEQSALYCAYYLFQHLSMHPLLWN